MKKALIVWGGWDGHDPEEGAHIIADMLRGDGFEVQIETQTQRETAAVIHRSLIGMAENVRAGIADFDYTSEQYYMHTDPSNEVLATTTFSGEHAPWTKGVVMPVVWKRMYGKGRVFYSALGHKATEFNVPQMKTILHRGLLWAAR